MKRITRLSLIAVAAIMPIALSVAFSITYNNQVSAQAPAAQTPAAQTPPAKAPDAQAPPAKAPAAQAPTPTPAPQMPLLPPDRKAFTDAQRITDPPKKIEALEKLLIDFPRSSMISTVHQELAKTLAKSLPDQQDRILIHANLAVEKANEFSRRFTFNQIATDLTEAGVLLDKAEEFANRALALAEEEQMKALRMARASHQSLVGRIYLKKGKVKEAEKAFTAAYNAVPLTDASPTTLRQAALGLAEIHEKSGKYDKALDYLSTAALFGKADAKLRERLEAAYRKTNHNSAAGLVEMIDAKYEKMYPHPVKAEPYQPTKARTNRTVLAEVFTGSGCPPCVAADLAFDAYLERYSRKDMIVLMYHLHIPLPDPMTNPSTQARSGYYTVRGVPSFMIDGDSSQSGGGPRNMTKDVYERLRPMIDKQLETEAGAEIRLTATFSGSVVTVTANVANLKKGVETAKLQIALVEEKLRYSGENGIRFHPVVVRSLAGEGGKGIALDAAKLAPAEWRFDINAITEENKKHLDKYEEDRKADNFTFSEKMHAIDPSKLSIVAFVQDEKTKQVLQAASLKLSLVQTAVSR